MTHEQNLMDEAVRWHLRLSDCDSDAWETFTQWLEADPRHVVAYDAVVTADEDVGGALLTSPRSPPASNENDSGRRAAWHRPRLIGGAVAASLTLLSVGLISQQPWANHRYLVATQPGEQRRLTLADGTQVALNGGTVLELDHGDPRYAALNGGEATFDVVHNAAHPFTLHVGETEVRDVGTVFNVIREQNEDIVEVKEGRVSVDQQRNTVALTAGQVLDTQLSTGQHSITDKRIAAIGSWRDGRLSYKQNSFYLVAQDVSRNLGVPVKVDAEMINQKFSGTIQIDRNRPRFFKNLGALLGTRIEQEGAGWRISASKT